MKNSTAYYDEEQELFEEEQERRDKKARRKKVQRVIDRIFGFILATGILFGVAGLAVEYVLVKGPSPALRNMFVNTMLETRRFGFIANVYLSEAEIDAIKQAKQSTLTDTTDTSLIKLPNQSGTGTGGDNQTDPAQPDGTDGYGLVDDDGDGIIIEQVRKKGFQGYMMVVLDPSRVFVGKPESFGGYGDYLATMCERYGAVGGINGGAYYDVDGAGLGGTPQGLTIIDGVCYDDAGGGVCSFVGFDANHILHTGYMTYADAQAKGIVDGVTFEPVLIVNGQMEDTAVLNTGTNPRSAIGQRADGAVLMLVIDGRQVHSAGATQQDVAEVMLDYGAVNACSLDGGSSTCMWFNGEYLNSISGGSGVAYGSRKKEKKKRLRDIHVRLHRHRARARRRGAHMAVGLRRGI